MMNNQTQANSPQSGQSRNPNNTRQPRIMIRANADVNINSKTYEIIIEVNAFQDGKPMANQDIILKEKISVLDSKKLDNNGEVTLRCSGSLTGAEQIKNLRINLTGISEEKNLTVTIPAAEQKIQKDTDPDSLVLCRYHDGEGNFRTKVRVLSSRGIGLYTKVTMWYMGVMSIIKTNKSGDAVFNIPNQLEPNEEYQLTASVSGIVDEAKIDIKRRKPLIKLKMFSPEWWRTNNARAFIACNVIIIAWLIMLLASGNGQPIINPNLFRDETGLSKSEQYYNSAITISNPKHVIAPIKSGNFGWNHPGILGWYGILTIITILVLVYSVFSLREEIATGIEEGVEKLFDKDYAKAGDPAFERLIKFAGSYNVARSPKPTVSDSSDQKSENNNNSSNAELNNSGHHGLATILRMDLLGDALIAIVPFILKRIF